jgi:hypothetical protein
VLEVGTIIDSIGRGWRKGSESSAHEAQPRSLCLVSKWTWDCDSARQEKRGRKTGIKTEGKKEN